MILVRVYPRNSLQTKLTMEEKGKEVNLETDEEEEYLEDIIIEEDEDEGVEEETEGVILLTKFPAYVPTWKGNAKVPKDLNDSKSPLHALMLPNDIIFEGVHLGRVWSLKFED